MCDMPLLLTLALSLAERFRNEEYDRRKTLIYSRGLKACFPTLPIGVSAADEMSRYSFHSKDLGAEVGRVHTYSEWSI
jgi:hypothetical protein